MGVCGCNRATRERRRAVKYGLSQRTPLGNSASSHTCLQRMSVCLCLRVCVCLCVCLSGWHPSARAVDAKSLHGRQRLRSGCGPNHTSLRARGARHGPVSHLHCAGTDSADALSVCLSLFTSLHLSLHVSPFTSLFTCRSSPPALYTSLVTSLTHLCACAGLCVHTGHWQVCVIHSDPWSSRRLPVRVPSEAMGHFRKQAHTTVSQHCRVKGVPDYQPSLLNHPLLLLYQRVGSGNV